MGLPLQRKTVQFNDSVAGRPCYKRGSLRCIYGLSNSLQLGEITPDDLTQFGVIISTLEDKKEKNRKKKKETAWRQLLIVKRGSASVSDDRQRWLTALVPAQALGACRRKGNAS